MLVLRLLLLLFTFSLAAISLAAGPFRFEKKFQDLTPGTSYDTDWIFAPDDEVKVGKVQLTLEGKGCEMVLEDFTYRPVQAGVIFKIVESKSGEPYPIDDIVTAFRVQFRVTKATKECNVVVTEAPAKIAVAPAKVASLPGETAFTPAPIDTRPKWSSKEARQYSYSIHTDTTALQIYFVLVEGKGIRDYSEVNQSTKAFHAEISKIYKESWKTHADAEQHFPAADQALAKMVTAQKKLPPRFARELEPVWTEVIDEYAKLKNYFATTSP
jgi:hypothetical protein